MQEEKKYHLRKLAIIEMIEECDERILREKQFTARFERGVIVNNISARNITRYQEIKNYLTERYNR